METIRSTSVVLVLLSILTIVEAAVRASEPGTIFREDCFDIFFNKKDFLNQECLKFTISKFIGYGIVCGSAILKIPQIIKIMKNQSVEGISKFLFYLEVIIIFLNSIPL